MGQAKSKPADPFVAYDGINPAGAVRSTISSPGFTLVEVHRTKSLKIVTDKKFTTKYIHIEEINKLKLLPHICNTVIKLSSFRATPFTSSHNVFASVLGSAFSAGLLPTVRSVTKPSI